MIISLIAAMDEQAGIGKNSQLPWHLTSDLARFKKFTMGHYIVMGRKTYESIGQSLPGRKTIILTRQSNYQGKDCQVVSSLDAAIQLAKDAGEEELFITGGGEVYKQSILIADKIYMTYVHTKVSADVLFPLIDLAQWEASYKEKILNDNDAYPSDFVIYERKKKQLS